MLIRREVKFETFRQVSGTSCGWAAYADVAGSHEMPMSPHARE